MSTQRPRLSSLGLESTLLSLFLLGSVSGAAFAQIEPATAELFDSKGTLIGPVLDFNSRPEANVALLIDGHSAILRFTPTTINSLPPLGGDGVVFASSDCTGQAYSAVFVAGELVEARAIGGPNYTFFAGGQGPVVQNLPFLSRLHPGEACSPPEAGLLLSAVAVSPVRDLIPYWQPPFRIVNTRGAASVPAVSTLGLAAIAAALALGGLFLLRRRLQR